MAQTFNDLPTRRDAPRPCSCPRPCFTPLSRCSHAALAPLSRPSQQLADRLDLTTLEQLQPGFFYSQFTSAEGGGLGELGGGGFLLKTGTSHANDAGRSGAFGPPSPGGPGDPMTIDRFKANFVAVLKLDLKKNMNVIRAIEQVRLPLTHLTLHTRCTVS